MLPLWLDLAGRKVVVFGGGPVGRRKANYLAAEAEVTVVAREFVEEFDERVRLVQADIGDVMEQWIKGAELVVAATDDSVLNNTIAEAAARSGKFCNRADDVSTFLIPSVVERENYKVAISTEGRSPGMSKYLRMEMERLLLPRYDRMIELQEQLRGEAKRSLTSQRLREERLWEILNDQSIWNLLETDPAKARKLAVERLVR